MNKTDRRLAGKTTGPFMSGPHAEHDNTPRTSRALGGAHVPPTKLFSRFAVNKTILKPRVAAARRAPNTHTWDFPDVIKFRVAAHTISEKAIRFRHPD